MRTKRKMMNVIPYILLSVGLLLAPLRARSQDNPPPDTKAYEALKKKGLLKQPAPATKQENYPVLRDARERMQKDNKFGMTYRPDATTQGAQRQNFPCTIEDPRGDPSFQVLFVNDDSSSSVIPLKFTFNFFGNNYNELYVNNNGNVTFNAPNPVYNATGFPSPPYDMIAPFWADVDTRGFGNGRVYFKSEPDKFTVIWFRVGYFEKHIDKRNTFKLILTDGTNPLIGVGNNVAFYYGDMQWTSGDASGSNGGFGGNPASVGMNNSQGEGACFYYQLGRFDKPGSEYIDPFQPSGVDYLDGRCFTFDASTVEDLAFDFDYKNLLCAIDFRLKLDNPQNCHFFHKWDFGDGNQSIERNPLHSYNAPGNYTVKLQAFYKCGACQDTTVTLQKQITVDPQANLFKDTLIQVNTALKADVLSTTATTFSDTWPLAHEAQALSNRSGYLNGSQGVWRREGTYVYDVDRRQSPGLSLAQDGTFELEQFNWENAALNAIPNWIKANTATVYSPFGHELENRDAIGVNSAALYDYGGHLPSANGANMRHDEMAYTGFEYLTGKSSGNWIFGNQPLPWYRWFGTLYNYKHIVVVKASLKELEGYDKADVYGRSYFWFFFSHYFRYRYLRDNEIVCRQEYAPNPDWSVLVFRRALFEGFWRGYIRLRNEVKPIISPDIDSTLAHSGQKSLKVTDTLTYEQSLLRLDSGKSYHLSAWVSVNDPHSPRPVLAENLGIDITIKDKDDLKVATFSLSPSGSIIEGWQQVKGSFTCPVKNTTLSLQFRPGSTGTAWYDDLRLHPTKGNMQSYVYDLKDYRLQAILDGENFASFFYYDEEGNLHLTKKETKDGIKTITENISYTVER